MPSDELSRPRPPRRPERCPRPAPLAPPTSPTGTAHNAEAPPTSALATPSSALSPPTPTLAPPTSAPTAPEFSRAPTPLSPPPFCDRLQSDHALASGPAPHSRPRGAVRCGAGRGGPQSRGAGEANGGGSVPTAVAAAGEARGGDGCSMALSVPVNGLKEGDKEPVIELFVKVRSGRGSGRSGRWPPAVPAARRPSPPPLPVPWAARRERRGAAAGDARGAARGGRAQRAGRGGEGRGGRPVGPIGPVGRRNPAGSAVGPRRDAALPVLRGPAVPLRGSVRCPKYRRLNGGRARSRFERSRPDTKRVAARAELSERCRNAAVRRLRLSGSVRCERRHPRLCVGDRIGGEPLCGAGGIRVRPGCEVRYGTYGRGGSERCRFGAARLCLARSPSRGFVVFNRMGAVTDGGGGEGLRGGAVCVTDSKVTF